LGYSSEEVNSILLKKKWYVRLTGYSDLRDIEAEAEKGNRMSVSLSDECLSYQEIYRFLYGGHEWLDAIILLLE
jgi:hypothetical protein